MELAVSQAQAGYQRAQMRNGGLGDTLSHRDRGLTQEAMHPLGIKPADPVLLEQSGQRRLAQACGLGRGGRQRPQIQDPLGCDVVAHREQLRVGAPELLADAVAQAHALVLELLRQARPLPQRNHDGVAGLDGPEQVRVRAQSAGCDPSIASVILGPSQADAVAQTLELLGIDRMHGEAAVQESIHHRPVRHLNGHRDPPWLARDRHQPVAQGGQTGSAVPKRPLAHNLDRSIEKADLVRLRAPIDASKPAYDAIGHDRCPPGMTRATTTPADPVRALEGATSYWASVVAGPPRHMSRNGAQGTNTMMVTLGRSARLVSLHQGRPDIADGTGYGDGDQHWP